jgi:16S rRNA (guanine966-N2)-methyltransferase
LLHENGILVLHRNKNTKKKLPNYFKIIDERRYGISKVIFGKFLS